MFAHSAKSEAYIILACCSRPPPPSHSKTPEPTAFVACWNLHVAPFHRTEWISSDLRYTSASARCVCICRNGIHSPRRIFSEWRNHRRWMFSSPSWLISSYTCRVGGVFNLHTLRTWEWDSSFPCRSILPPAWTTGIPMAVLKVLYSSESDVHGKRTVY